ncbi:hypothetical protein E4U41_001569 [Claviceps citrina]|nr:hypothetical protein E4U41_001569 [Claviceps citrina]
MGHHNIRFDGDPYSLAGVWGPPTSRANFCEEDYALTLYLTEFINSLSNITYVYFALRYMYGPGSRGLLAPRWDAMSVSLLVLGMASFLFHASLRHTLEFADELSMMGLTWSMLQATCTMGVEPSRTRRRHAISASLGVCFLSFAVFYLGAPQILYHVAAFVLSLAVLVVRTAHLLYWRRPAFAAAKRRDWRVRTWTSVALGVLAYVIWTIDLEFCAELRTVRRRVGLPWAWLLELHGWWHVLTAVGAGRFMDVVREMGREVEEERAREKGAKEKEKAEKRD